MLQNLQKCKIRDRRRMLQGGQIQNGTEWTVLLFAKCNILQPLVGLDFNARNSVIFSEGFYPPPQKTTFRTARILRGLTVPYPRGGLTPSAEAAIVGPCASPKCRSPRGFGKFQERRSFKISCLAVIHKVRA